MKYVKIPNPSQLFVLYVTHIIDNDQSFSAKPSLWRIGQRLLTSLEKANQYWEIERDEDYKILLNAVEEGTAGVPKNLAYQTPEGESVPIVIPSRGFLPMVDAILEATNAIPSEDNPA